MKCDDPFFVNLKNPVRQERAPVPCGKCPNCKKRRVASWIFRLQEEEKRSSSAHFVTLTYDSRFIPISEGGWMTLSKRHLELYFKRLRKRAGKGIKYYAVGEYGSRRGRPHYHMIVFNVPDTQMYVDAWNGFGMDLPPEEMAKYDVKKSGHAAGSVFVGSVSGASIAYTLKYIDKDTFREKREKDDDRLREFSLMSKGLGSNFVTSPMVRYYHSDISRLYVTGRGGHRLPMPRYYRQKIFSKRQMKKQIPLIQAAMLEEEKRQRLAFDRLVSEGSKYESFQAFLEAQKRERWRGFYHSSKHSRKDV